MSIKRDVTIALHPTEIHNPSPGLPALADGLQFPTCRRPPLGLFSSTNNFSTSTTHPLPFYTDPSRMDTDEDGVTDYIELQGWDVIVIHERRGEVMEDRCEYGVWSLPIRYDSEGDGASDEIEWKFHGNPDSSDSDKDGIPDREESGPNLTMVEGTPPVILDKKGRDKSSEKYSGAYIKTKVKVKTKWSISGVKIKGKIIVIFTVVDNAGLDRAVIYVQTGGERIIYLGRDKRREIEEVFEIGDLLRLIHGGYDVRVNVTDINGNWATGKTHIDSALQTLKKGLSALLEILKAVARIIAKVASMLLDTIKRIVLKMTTPIKHSIMKNIRNWGASFVKVMEDMWLSDKEIHTRGIFESVEQVKLLLDYLTLPFILVTMLVTVAKTIDVLINVFSAGTATMLEHLGNYIAHIFIMGSVAIGFGFAYSYSNGAEKATQEFMGESAEFFQRHLTIQETYFELLSKLLLGSKVAPALTYAILSILFTTLLPDSIYWQANLLRDAIGLILAVVGLIDLATNYDEIVSKSITPLVAAITVLIVPISLTTSIFSVILDFHEGLKREDH